MTEIALIGKKIGMTREFYKTGRLVPVTVIKMEKARVISVIEEDKNASNIISDLSYKNIDYKGNIFNINSKITKIFEDKEDLNFMEVVVCRIFLLDGRVIEVFADKAIYNTINYDTKFAGNVLVVEDENKITSNNLDFIFGKNLITIFNNVKYKGYNKFLTADKVDINLLNHKVNVYMYDKMGKVKANLRN